MHPHQEVPPVPPAEELPTVGNDGTDLTLIHWMLDLSPLERLRAFETFMADITAMFDAANRSHT